MDTDGKPTYADEGKEAGIHVKKKDVIGTDELMVDIKPKPNCKYCYGRGYEGRNIKTNRIVVCRCVIKKIDKLKKGGYIDVRRLRALERRRDSPSVEERRESSGGIRLSDSGGEEKRLGSPKENAPERSGPKKQDGRTLSQ
jgi:hypothetical protein